jgi:hypothetical protein
MANKNFVVHNGLSVGPTTIEASSGNVSVPQGKQILVGNVILRDNGDGKLRVRDITDNSDAEIVGTFSAVSTTAGNIQIGTNHIESTNTNGEISFRPNGNGELWFSSNTIDIGRGGAITISTGYKAGFANGNVTLDTTQFTVTGNVIAGNVSATRFFGDGSQLTGIDATAIQNGTSNVRVFNSSIVAISSGGTANIVTVNSTGLTTTGNVSAANLTSSFGLWGTLRTASQPNITSVGTLGSLSVTGAVTVGSIVNGGADTVGNIGVSDDRFNSVHAVNLYGTLQTAAQTNITSVGTLGSLSVTGNVGAANLTSSFGLWGTVRTASQPNITSVGTLTGLTMGGALAMGTNKITGLGTPTAATDATTKEYVDLVAEGLSTKPAVEIATTGNLTATYNNGTLGVGATLTATTNGAFPNIDGVTLTSITPGENGVLVKNQTPAAHNGRYNLTQVGSGSTPWILTRCGLCDEADEIPGAYVFVKRGTLYTGTGWVQTVANPSTFTVGTDAITVTQFSGAGTYTAGTGLTLTGNQFSVNAIQTQITQVGTLTSGTWNAGIINSTYGGTGVNNGGRTLTVNTNSGTISFTAAATTLTVAAAASVSGTNTGDQTSVTGNAGSATVLQTARNINGVSFNGSADITVTANASTLTGTTLASGVTASSLTSVGTIATGTWNATTIATNKGGTGLTSFTSGGALYATSTSALTTGTLPVASGGTGVTTSTGSGAVVLGTSPTFTTQITTPVIVKSGTTGVGNIGQSDNSFNTVFAKATSAQYADLAEKYTADQDYEPGTVLHFGGDYEVSQCNQDMCSRVAGVVSTNPAYRMNDNLVAEHIAMVALTGRVPCKVVGPVVKGDMMVSAGNGHARAEANPKLGSVIGKALENFSGSEGVIEVVVGRL